MGVLLFIIASKYILGKMAVQKAKNNTQMQRKILAYIEENEGNAFDFSLVSKQFNLTFKQIYKYLQVLSNDEKIIAQQKHLRKPILLSDDDFQNFYWKVYIRTDKHPYSKLGNFEG